ncbi:hypothetical protein RN001_001971 [Aquatica leii]|uniref:DDE Tnp4 domain-containing protein n=1 Tax=Aquatica leii TaxID=1421715 RepID=A0AAN7PCP5_9COLE|nr:hypothetical protein RN001_001971 [Aquatica leii]
MENRKRYLAALGLGLLYLRLNKRKTRRWWVRPINRNQMRLQDPEQFFNYTRLTTAQFDLLLTWIGPSIAKNSFREPISPGARLALTLRHLASGDSIPTLAFSYRIGKSTACMIINETCDALWIILQPRVLQPPNKIEWQEISSGFQTCWNLPNCVGSMDGEHVRIRAPYNSGSTYFNYKKTFSIVLFAVCDYKYCFTHVDIGAYGSQSDGGVLKLSKFGYNLNNGQLDLPEDMPFPGMQENKPFYFVGDEAFPLQMNLLRPFGGKNLTHDKQIYNYRLSRARRCIENAFGILASRFRLFHTTILKNPEHVGTVIKACVLTLEKYLGKMRQ